MLRLLQQFPIRNGTSVDMGDKLLALASGASRGDARAVRTLLTTLGPHFLRVVRRVFGARHPDLQDVVQECATEFISALPRFRRESSVKHFACRVALQTAISARRRYLAGKRDAGPYEPVAADTAADDGLSPDEQAAMLASLRILRGLCCELPPVQAEVLALHFILGHTVNEVAAICAVPVETVRSRLRLAKQALVGRALANRELREYLEATL